MKDEKILVTGGAGFLGQYVVRNLRIKYPTSEIIIQDQKMLISGIEKLL